MITTLVGFCESLTFCAPSKVNTVGNIAKACQQLRFRDGVVFVTFVLMQKANVLSRIHLNML